MDALTAIGLASNVLSFVQFASELIQASKEISSSPSGCTADVAALEKVYTRLQSLSSGLKSCQLYKSEKVDDSDDSLSTDYHEQKDRLKAVKAATALSDLAEQCVSDCDELLGITAKLKVGSQPPGKWRSFQAALRKFWEKDKIAALEGRLQRAQRTMTLHFCMVTRSAHVLLASRKFLYQEMEVTDQLVIISMAFLITSEICNAKAKSFKQTRTQASGLSTTQCRALSSVCMNLSTIRKRIFKRYKAWTPCRNNSARCQSPRDT